MSKTKKADTIEINGKKEADSGLIQLPVNFISVGQVENDDVKVYIRQDIYKSIEKFASSDVKNELGSILIGDYINEMGKNHVVISGYIEAEYTDASASTLTFTHQTWEYIHEEHERLFPDNKIIGWQHTHPDYGIFLSNYDMFIQENFFNLPWQVAYVVDPVNKTRGFFQWKNDKVQKLDGFYIYDEAEKKIDITEAGNSSAEPDMKKREAFLGLKKFDIVILVTVFIISVGLIASIFSIWKLKDSLETARNQLASAEEKNKELESKNSSLTAQLGEINQTQGQTANTQVEKNKNLNTPGSNTVFLKYEVKAGDTVISICKKLNIDYYSNIKAIKNVNGLENLNSVKAGQILLIPACK